MASGIIFHFLAEVTKILLFAAQASHQLVPPEVSAAAGRWGNGTEFICERREKRGFGQSLCLEKLLVVLAALLLKCNHFHKFLSHALKPLSFFPDHPVSVNDHCQQLCH